MFFFVSGRYKEQLKLLYKVHKVICCKVFFEHTDTETLRLFAGAEDTESS